MNNLTCHSHEILASINFFKLRSNQELLCICKQNFHTPYAIFFTVKDIHLSALKKSFKSFFYDNQEKNSPLPKTLHQLFLIHKHLVVSVSKKRK